MKPKVTIVLLFLFICISTAHANKITATPSNYSSYTSGLLPGDTLYLTAGNYMSQLYLSGLSGTVTNPIVIMGAGNTTVFLGNACCNTVNITNCSYLVIKDFKINGQNIDYVFGVSAGGGATHWAHHITLENLYIINNGGTANDNQTDGISTKCAAWNWTIRGCTIIAAGTGLYLGNSDGSCPFVGGLIENNLVINTKGYNMEIKQQADGQRALLAGTSTDYQKTIIRYNVWSKDSGVVTADGARPCILVGAFPTTSFGANDVYEIYGNFFYNNYSEALVQITGNAALYSNVFVNHFDPSGYRTVLITSQNGFKPRTIHVFHNTLLSNTTSYGIRVYDADPAYNQYSYANAAFSANPITGFTNVLDDVTDTYANAGNYINSPSTTLSSLDLYPKAGKLTGTLTSNTLFTGFTDYDKDFNGNIYNWIYRGAYSGSGTNPGWHLKLAIRPTPPDITTGITGNDGVNNFLGMVYPNPANSSFDLVLNMAKKQVVKVQLINLEGQVLKILYEGEMNDGDNKITTHVSNIAAGFYIVNIHLQDRVITKKILIKK